MLHDTFKDLESQNIPVSRDLEDALMLLHSYVLVKLLVKQVAESLVVVTAVPRASDGGKRIPCRAAARSHPESRSLTYQPTRAHNTHTRAHTLTRRAACVAWSKRPWTKRGGRG